MKRVKIEFTTQAWALAKHLEENADTPFFFDVNSTNHVLFDSTYGFLNRVREEGSDRAMNLQDFTRDHYYIEQPWEETVSEDNPVLCWCWMTGGSKFILNVTAVKNGDRQYKTGLTYFDNAEPLTLEEAKKYIYECQGGEE